MTTEAEVERARTVGEEAFIAAMHQSTTSRAGRKMAPIIADFARSEVKRTVDAIVARMRASGNPCLEHFADEIEREFGGGK